MGHGVICCQMLSDLPLLWNASLGSEESQARMVEIKIIILSALRGESSSVGCLDTADDVEGSGIFTALLFQVGEPKLGCDSRR